MWSEVGKRVGEDLQRREGEIRGSLPSCISQSEPVRRITRPKIRTTPKRQNCEKIMSIEFETTATMGRSLSSGPRSGLQR